jgi:hypothetical protein
MAGKSNPVAIGLIGCVTVVFVVGIFVLVFFMVRPRGEKLGVTSLTDPGASLGVDGKPGDSLYFRTDASVAIPKVTFADDNQRERALTNALRKSQLTVRATSPTGVERIATCPIYNGRSSSSSTFPGTFTQSGMLNDCVIPIDAAGRWTVRGSVAWSPDLALVSATLETRREDAAAK